MIFAHLQRLRFPLLGKLKALTTHVNLEDVPRIAGEIVAGRIRGWVVVDL